MAINMAIVGIGPVEGCGDPVRCCLEHLQVNRQLPPVLDGDAMLGRIGVQHGWNIVLGMARGKQHARHRQHMIDALFPQPVQPVLDHRGGKFEVAIFHRPVRENGGELFSQHRKFGHRRF